MKEKSSSSKWKAFIRKMKDKNALSYHLLLTRLVKLKTFDDITFERKAKEK